MRIRLRVFLVSSPPWRRPADDGPSLAGFHNHGVTSAVKAANRIFRQDAAQKGSLPVEPAQAVLFEPAETAFRWQQVPALRRVDQSVDRIIAHHVESAAGEDVEAFTGVDDSSRNIVKVIDRQRFTRLVDQHYPAAIAGEIYRV